MVKMISRLILYYRKPLAIVVIIVVFLGLLGGALRSYVILAGKKELEKALYEADQSDPCWRVDELEQKRLILKDEENSAIQLLKASKLIPPGWWTAGGKLAPNGLPFIYSSGELPAEEKLADWQAVELRARLEQAVQAVAEARKLVTFSSGRFPFDTHQTLIWSTLTERALLVSMLLELDSVLLAEDQKTDLALLDAGAILQAGRAIGDEPVGSSQALRLACTSTAVKCMERTLAQGQAPDRVLSQLQGLLDMEEVEPILLIMARAERAWWHQTMEALEAGDIDIDQITGEPAVNVLPFDPLKVYSPTLPLCHAWILRFMNKYVEIAKRAWPEQEEQLQQLAGSVDSAPILAKSLLGSQNILVERARIVHGGRALLRCAIVALAVERYRMIRGRWPDSLSELVPQFLPRLPTDPFNGNALRYRKTENGVIIYSLGNDKKDNGGLVQKRRSNGEVFEATYLAFRLWNVDKRRQPPPTFNEGNNPEAINK